uniref:hypothetical protein n=1 Tax=Desertibaculum subflavum TaxID=2268458 RepID=UPI0034D33A6B
ATLLDMLNDENRTGTFAPDGFSIGRNIVGSGADIDGSSLAINEPAAVGLLGWAVASFGLWYRRHRRTASF